MQVTTEGKRRRAAPNTRRIPLGRNKPRKSRAGRGVGSDQLFRREIPLDFDPVSVQDLPLTRRESMYHGIVEYVAALPKGCGIRLKHRYSQPDAKAKAAAIMAWGKRIGKVVTTQIRHAGGAKGRGHGYELWVFKRRDWIAIKKRQEPRS